MTGKKIKEDALLYAAVGGYNVQDPIAVDFINRAVDLIMVDYNEVGKISTANYTIDTSSLYQWQDLPDDLLAIRRIYYTAALGQNPIDVQQYLVQNNQIRFDVAGSFVVEYVPIPDYMFNIDREAPLNSMWHPAISYYVAYRIKAQIFGDEEGEKNELYARFENYCSKVSSRLNRKKPRRTMKAPMWG